MPRLWSDTVEAHRRAVREATLEVTATLVAQHGLRGVTMSQVAGETGIGRATLYKYFADIDAILVEWHERQIADHLAQLEELADRASNTDERLEAVLEAYALIRHRHRGGKLAGLLHGADHVARAHGHLRRFVRRLLSEAAEAGTVRRDVPADELAAYCVHALDAAGALSSKAAVRRLVAVTLRSLRPDGTASAARPAS